jgi:hypothetical protein
MFRRPILALSLLALAACEAAPTGPSATLSLSQTSLTLGRNGTDVIKATLASSDVTASAVWSSSNPAVVTVEAGALRAIGLGSATVTVTYRERTAAMQVTVRRNTAIGGVFAMRDVAGLESFGCVGVRMDGVEIGGRCGSDHRGSVRQEARFGRLSAIRDRAFVVNPGVLPLTVDVSLHGFVGQQSRQVATEDVSYIEFIDADTGESVERASLPRQDAVVTRSGILTMPVTVKIYTQ